MGAKTTRLLDGFRDVAVVVAVISTIGLLAQTYLQPDNQPCRIATDFLMDDIKDVAIVDAATAIRLRKLYVDMAQHHCGED